MQYIEPEYRKSPSGIGYLLIWSNTKGRLCTTRADNETDAKLLIDAIKRKIASFENEEARNN